MNYDDILHYCYDVIEEHFNNKKVTSRSIARYGVASYIRDNVKKHNRLQKLVIRLFRI